MAVIPAPSTSSPPALGTGTEWIVDALDCDPNRLRDLGLVRELCDQVVMDLGLNVLGEPQSHRFGDPGGVTLLYMLSESHLACHTYPEYRLATFNLYCCRARSPWDWDEKLREWLGSGGIETRQVARGLPSLDNGATS